MKAEFYNRRGRLVWTCTRDAQYEFSNGTRAIRKGAVRAVLYDAAGQMIDKTSYSI